MGHSPFRTTTPSSPERSRAGGRSRQNIVDGRLLGAARNYLRPASPALDLKWLAPTGEELLSLLMIGRLWRPRWNAARVGARMVTSRLRGQRLLGAGRALVARLRLCLVDLEVPVILNTPMSGLATADSPSGARIVTGVMAMHGGKTVTVTSTRGVVLACGGFAHNQAMRDSFLPQPNSSAWSMAALDGDRGDGLVTGRGVGAALDLTDHVWGMPTVVVPHKSGQTISMLTLGERSQPGTMIVDQTGVRYANEALSYPKFRDCMLARNAAGVAAVPSWLIFDQRAKNRYLFMNIPPRIPFPRHWYRSGAVIKAPTIGRLADQMRISCDALTATVEHFNQMARLGRDKDFNRGETFYDRRYGDPRLPNPSLGPIDKAPFYAVRLYPGDIGTCGGLLIDEHSRVLDNRGRVISGLYAAGNTSASIMGGTYPGGGGTIGPAMVTGSSAGKHLAGSS